MTTPPHAIQRAAGKTTRPVARPVKKAKASDTASHQFRLLDHLPHLLRRAYFEAEAIFPVLFGNHVTSRQLALLVAIGRAPGASQREVAEQIGLDPNTCSDLVARSIKKGLISRKRSATDERTFCLHLTNDGLDVMNHGIQHAAHYQAALAQHLTDVECRQLKDLLQKLLGFG